MNKLQLVALLGVVFSGSALADPCGHPEFVTHECLEAALEAQDGVDGVDGIDGIDGIAGVDGRDGVDGKDGIAGRDGKDGVDGKDGIDGVVPTDWNKEINRYLAATSAIQIYLPQDATSRVTFGVSRVNSETGLGIGYAYRCHDCERDVALTIGLGTAKGETTGKASIGWEF